MMNRVKILALGGCGGMGQFAVRTALNFDFIDTIVIADRNGERASELARLYAPKTVSLQLDIEDTDSLKGALKDVDIVLATVGPYYRFGVPILKAAIESGCHYIDINDDWEPTLEMLDLDEKARKAGITAIIGMGASPGISNLLAVKAIEQLDVVDDLITGWGAGDSEEDSFGEPGEGGTFGAAAEHWVHQFTGTIRLLRNGAFADVPPLEKIPIDYPGIGKGTTHTVGHPEPITLSRFRPEIKNSYNVMDFPPYLISLLRWVAKKVNAGRMSVGEAADWIMGLETLGFSRLLLSRAGPSLLTGIFRQMVHPEPSFPSEFAYATGILNGRRTRVGVHLSSAPFGGMEVMTMGAVTGIPMALALKMIVHGQITKRGVLTPEEAVDPDSFFNELAPLCTPARKDWKELLVIAVAQ